jgi:hypothetical protein
VSVAETFRPAKDDHPAPLERDVLKPKEHKWFGRAIRALNRERIPFLVAGAFGLYHYTGFWRGTKDLDVLVLPEYREAAIEAVTGAGMKDLFDQEPYDREWIYRSTRDGVIFDIIWRLANKADDVDHTWFEHASNGVIEGEPVKVVSAADMCWMKLFVFQRNRCDWPDIMNVIRGTGGKLNWNHLLTQVGPHWRLLYALIEIFDWVCPGDRHYVPDWFREELERRRRADTPDDRQAECRNDLFDTRPWLTAPGAGYTGEH